jgi:hypothetical protein
MSVQETSYEHQKKEMDPWGKSLPSLRLIRQKLAFRLEKILDASVHDLQNGQLIVVDHKA